MANDKSIAVDDAVYNLQLSLLEGITKENQLFAAGSLMSRGDYEDVVTERSIASLCGYPLCRNPLPTDRPRKGWYRISLKEHKVYDLQETYMFCSTSCVVNSRAFAASLQDKRSTVLNSDKINEVLRLFDDLGSAREESQGKDGAYEFSRLRIQEKTVNKVSEASFKEWVGPSNAVEGYVPQRDRNSGLSPSENKKEEGSKGKTTKLGGGKNFLLNEVDFMSTIITNDGYSISKMSPESEDSPKLQPKGKDSFQEAKDQFTVLKTSSSPAEYYTDRKNRKPGGGKNKTLSKDDNAVLEVPSTSNAKQISHDLSSAEPEEKFPGQKTAGSGGTALKSSLKHPGSKKLGHSVTWADENPDDSKSNNLSEVRGMDRTIESPIIGIKDAGSNDADMLRFSSAEACAVALSNAAEAVATGESKVSDAVDEAGIIILPKPDHTNEQVALDNVDTLESDTAPLKWPSKPGIPRSDVFDPEDSWYDSPPQGFSLTLSPFATMLMALLSWTTSSSLAYIYGGDETSREEYSCVNGREYLRKIVLADGRSSEIKLTLAGCVSRALPGLVAELRLPTPVSSLEQGMASLLETMTFTDALPAFRVKQWQVIVLLFIEALSVCRIPSLTPHLTNRGILLHKVLDGAQIRMDEYEVMKDHIIPLGRAPAFAAQSGA